MLVPKTLCMVLLSGSEVDLVAFLLHRWLRYTVLQSTIRDHIFIIQAN
jgi:hypothetical protein